MDSLAANVAAILAPYQPNIPPDYPNDNPTAGWIAPTIIGAGHPIQVRVLTRLENKMSQVCVYAGNGNKLFPYINQYVPYVLTVNNVQQVFWEVASADQEMVVEVWSYDRPSRALIENLIMSGLTEAYIQQELDTTTTRLTWTKNIQFDDEQSDSIYISRLYYNANYTMLSNPPGIPNQYLIAQVDTYMTVNEQVLGLVSQNFGGGS